MIYWMTAAAVGGIAAGVVGRALLHLSSGETAGRIFPPLGGAAGILLIFTIGKLASAAATPLVTRSLGRMGTLRAAYIVLALSCAAIPLATAPATVPAIALLAGLCAGGINLLNWAILPELAVLAGEARKGGMFGLFTCMSKIALGVSGLTAAWVIGDDGRLIRAESLWLAALVGLVSLMVVAALQRSRLRD